MKYLVFDISNLLYRTFFVKRDEDDNTLAGLATHMALVTLNKYNRQVKPDKVIMVFDRNSWRKEYTASKECVSQRPYKGNRRQDMTPSQAAKYQRFLGHLKEFESLIIKHTTIVTLFEDQLEADDLIAGFCQIYSDADNQITIISSDSDLLQLLKYPNVKIISPATDKPQDLKEYGNDPRYFLFTKCLRGDTTDNVQSAFPGVRATRIRKAYDDPFERVQLMKEKWHDQNKKEFIVEKVFKENELLMDLEKQPPEIRMKIFETVEREMSKDKKFSLFFIMKFLGKYELQKIKESIDLYLPMLSK